MNNLNTILRKVVRRISKELALYAERMKYPVSFKSLTLERDCFETVRELTRFCKPRTLCDVGAHKGSWTRMLHQMCPELTQVVMFEPQADLCEGLRHLDLPGVEVKLYNCGVGERAGTALIKGGSASASFLDAEPEQTDYFPGSIGNSEERAEIKALDDIFSKDRLPQPDVIKIDVQGYELNVLKGAEKLLERTKYVVIELSCRPLYASQPTLAEVLSFLEQRNFLMVARGYEWKSPRAPHEILQMDAVFMNSAI